MKSREPRVSIGMPVYNGENYLAEALDSLLAQTFADFELVISDNASSDATEAICREYASRDARIRVERQTENIGAVPNFNRVFELSCGDYFKWAAHDDVCQPTFLQSCVDILDEHPEVAWSHTRSDMIDADGRSWVSQLPEDAAELERSSDGSLWWKGPPREHHDAARPHLRYAGVLLGTNWCVDSYGLIRASALRKTRLLAPLYGAEKVLMGELSLLGAYMEAPGVLFAQRVHAAASSGLGTATAQHRVVARGGAGPLLSTRLALIKAHLGAVRHATLPTADRIRCNLVVVRYMFQVHKWRRVIGAAIRGTGVGGGGRRMLDARRDR